MTAAGTPGRGVPTRVAAARCTGGDTRADSGVMGGELTGPAEENPATIPVVTAGNDTPGMMGSENDAGSTSGAAAETIPATPTTNASVLIMFANIDRRLGGIPRAASPP